MNLKQLEYFVAIAEEQQITAAARRLHISQPPLSYELANLERELGVTLVKRGPRKATLTSAGKLLYDRATRILALANATQREVSAYGQGMKGVLSIGTISSSGGLVPPPSALVLRDAYPDVRFEVHEGNTYQVLDMLESGIIDLGVVRTPFPQEGLTCAFAQPEPMMAVATTDLAPNFTPEVPLGALAQKPLVIYRRFEALVRDAFEKSNLQVQIACLNDDARTTFAWARHGFGIGLVPASALETCNIEGLAVARIDCKTLETRQAVIWNPKRYLSPLAERFIDAFRRDADLDTTDIASEGADD